MTLNPLFYSTLSQAIFLLIFTIPGLGIMISAYFVNAEQVKKNQLKNMGAFIFFIPVIVYILAIAQMFIGFGTL